MKEKQKVNKILWVFALYRILIRLDEPKLKQFKT